MWTVRRPVLLTKVKAKFYRGLIQHVSLNPSINWILLGNSPGFEQDMVIRELLKPNIVAITETRLYN